MTVTRIEDGRDLRLGDYAGVREPRPLRERGLMIVEGRFVVARLLAATHVTVRSLLLNEAALLALTGTLEACGRDLDVYVAGPDVIMAATGFDIHRGCLALAERPPAPAMSSLLASRSFITVLERVVDPDNVGSVFRCAEAFGVEAVLLSPGCGDPYYRKAIRTSSGAALMVPWATAEPWPEALEILKAHGFLIAATTPDASAMDIGAFVATPGARGRVAVLMGTEGQGLTVEALSRADVRVRIPMSGALDSLNIATATGIALHRLHEVRRSP